VRITEEEAAAMLRQTKPQLRIAPKFCSLRSSFVQEPIQLDISAHTQHSQPS
jgi:hypothetical protein